MLAFAFLAISVGSLVDTAIWLGMISNISWVFYSIGYALLIYVYAKRKQASMQCVNLIRSCYGRRAWYFSIT